MSGGLKKVLCSTFLSEIQGVIHETDAPPPPFARGNSLELIYDKIDRITDGMSGHRKYMVRVVFISENAAGSRLRNLDLYF